MLVIIAIILFVISACIKKRYPVRSHNLFLAGICIIAAGFMIDFVVYCMNMIF